MKWMRCMLLLLRQRKYSWQVEGSLGSLPRNLLSHAFWRSSVVGEGSSRFWDSGLLGHPWLGRHELTRLNIDRPGLGVLVMESHIVLMLPRLVVADLAVAKNQGLSRKKLRDDDSCKLTRLGWHHRNKIFPMVA